MLLIIPSSSFYYYYHHIIINYTYSTPPPSPPSSIAAFTANVHWSHHLRAFAFEKLTLVQKPKCTIGLNSR